jgi:hypothetical protein
LREIEFWFIRSPYLWTIREISKSWLWMEAALFLGVPWGPGRGVVFCRDFERQMKKGSRKGASLFMAALKPGVRTLLQGTLKDM